MTATKSKSGELLVRQIRSGIGFNRDQKATLRALGLGKIGRQRRHPDNPQIRGMIFKVTHLVSVEAEDK
jgi:large subunit ribosomal protein L30